MQQANGEDQEDSGESFELRLAHDLDPIEEAWRDVEARSDGPPFLSWAWQRTWLETAGRASGALPCPVVVSAGGRPVMLLPLVLERQRLGAVLTWGGGELADYKGPLVARDCPQGLLGEGFRAVWRAALGLVPGVDFVLLDRMPDRLGGLRHPLLTERCEPATAESYQAVLEGDWESFYRAHTSSSTRSNDRRKARKLARHGAVEFQITETPAQVERLLPDFFKQKSDHYRSLGVADLFASSHHRDFVRLLTERAPELVHFSAILVDGRPAATHWGVWRPDRLYLMLPTFDRGELAAHSPGNLLCRRLLQWCFEQGIPILDFTLGDEPYKARWCDRQMSVWQHTAPRSARGRLAVAARTAEVRLRRYIKSDPVLYKQATRLRRALRG